MPEEDGSTDQRGDQPPESAGITSQSRPLQGVGPGRLALLIGRLSRNPSCVGPGLDCRLSKTDLRGQLRKHHVDERLQAADYPYQQDHQPYQGSQVVIDDRDPSAPCGGHKAGILR
ncbi:MAG: hypothetical protein ACRDI1_01840, partial [Actinomycetota bacterium]